MVIDPDEFGGPAVDREERADNAPGRGGGHQESGRGTGSINREHAVRGSGANAGIAGGAGVVEIGVIEIAQGVPGRDIVVGEIGNSAGSDQTQGAGCGPGREAVGIDRKDGVSG